MLRGHSEFPNALRLPVLSTCISRRHLILITNSDYLNVLSRLFEGMHSTIHANGYYEACTYIMSIFISDKVMSMLSARQALMRL